MQLLFEHSEEGDADGLGYLPGTVKKITGSLPVPHLGWNKLNSSFLLYKGMCTLSIHTKYTQMKILLPQQIMEILLSLSYRKTI